MQSALGSLRQAGPSKRVFIDKYTAAWGIGSDHLSLAGHYEFRIVKGSILICGITLTEDDATNNNNRIDNPKFYRVSAPVAPYPEISAQHYTSKDSTSLFPDLDGFPAIIEVRSTPDLIPDISDLAPPYKQLWHPTYQVSAEDATLQSPDSWKAIELSSPKFVLLGPKNSGKSNLAKFLCNRLLTAQDQKKRIFYLELDPGQPEFTVPGCLSLHEVLELNFSPGCFHPDFRNLVKCLYLGYVSPSETPDRYLDMCHTLLETYQAIKQRGDYLIVNTPGWTKGLGLELNTEIVAMTQGINDDNMQLFHMGDASAFALELNEVTGFSNNDSTGSTITQGGYSSAELRSLQIINYLHRYNTSHLTEWQPYEVNFSDIYLAVLDSAGIDLNDDLAVCIEGTLVAIVLLDDSFECHCDSNNVLQEIDANNLWQQSTCTGMAVVQRVNSQSLNLLLPIPPADMGIGKGHKVALIRGRVQLPIWEVHNKNLGNVAPWVMMNKGVGIGGSYTKFRRNIQR